MTGGTVHPDKTSSFQQNINFLFFLRFCGGLGVPPFAKSAPEAVIIFCGVLTRSSVQSLGILFSTEVTVLGNYLSESHDHLAKGR